MEEMKIKANNKDFYLPMSIKNSAAKENCYSQLDYSNYYSLVDMRKNQSQMFIDNTSMTSAKTKRIFSGVSLAKQNAFATLDKRRTLA